MAVKIPEFILTAGPRPESKDSRHEARRMAMGSFCGRGLVWTRIVQAMALAAVLTAPVWTARAQSGTVSPAPAAPAGTGTSATQITIDAIVATKDGIHVDGLNAGDFTLLDNGEPVKVLDFKAHQAREAAAGEVHVVIVFDTINTGVLTVAREREQLSEYMKQDGGKLAHPTSIGFLAESGVKLQQGSVMDGNAVLAALDKTESELRTVGRGGGFWGATERLSQSLEQLRKIVAFEGTKPGRKMLLFISPGWPLLSHAGDFEDTKQREGVFNTIVELTDELALAHTQLYTLSPFELGRTNPFYYQSFLKPVTKADHAEYPNVGLQVLSEHTGGTVQVTGNDIKDEINTAMRDASSWYTLTFEIAPSTEKTVFHALQIKVDKPDVKVRTSAGYYVKAVP